MNPWTKVSIWSGAALALCGTAYVGFALLMGARLREIPPFGAGGGSRPSAGTPATVPAVVPVSAAPVSEANDAPQEVPKSASLGLLDVFQIQSPYSADELQALAAELAGKRRELDSSLGAASERELRADQRAQQLDEHYAELVELRAGLERWQSELTQRQIELERAEATHKTRDDASWAKLAVLFNEGDASTLGPQLERYAPDEAARILHAVEPARAKELLDSLAAERWKDFAEAYRKADPTQH